MLVTACSTNGSPDRETIDAAAAAGHGSSTGAIMGSKSTSPDLALQLGREMAAAGDFHSAIGMFRRAHANKPGQLAPLLALGYALRRVGANHEAEEVYRRAVALRPHDPEALLGHGHTLIALGEAAVAQDRYQSAVKVAPRNHRIYNGLGVTKDLLGDHRGAQKQYRTGLEIASADASLRNNLGLSLALSGDYDAAIDLLRGLVQGDQTSPRYRQNLAMIYGLAGRPTDAETIARIDLSEQSVQNNLAYFEVLRSLDDRTRTAAVFGLNPVNVPSSKRAEPPQKQSAAPVPAKPVAQAPAAKPKPAAAETAPAAKVAKVAKAPPTSLIPSENKTEKTTVTARPKSKPARTTRMAGDVTQPTKTPASDSKSEPATPVKEKTPEKPVIWAGTKTDTPKPANKPAKVPPKPALKTVKAAKPAPAGKGRATPPPFQMGVELAASAPVGWQTKTGYGVQVGSYRSETAAKTAWRELLAQQGDLLRDLGSATERVDLGRERGVYFRLRAGPVESRRAAMALCGRLELRGHGCMVTPVSIAAPTVTPATPPANIAAVTPPAATKPAPAKPKAAPTVTAETPAMSEPKTPSEPKSPAKIATAPKPDTIRAPAEPATTPAAVATVRPSPAPAAEPKMAEATPPVAEPKVVAAKAPEGLVIYEIQLGAFDEPAAVRPKWNELRGKYQDLLGDLKAEVRPLALAGRTTPLYRLRAGPVIGKDAAFALCTELVTRGQPCLFHKRPATAEAKATDLNTE